MSQQDFLMFVTGVVGRSMGSGAFTAPGAIQELTQEAIAAFLGHVAPKLAQSATAPSPAPAASQEAQKPNWAAGAVALGAEAETMPFSVWSGDKAYLFGNNDKTWGEWLAEAQSGDSNAHVALDKAAKAKLGADPKWHAANQKRINRAKACMTMLRGQP